MSTVVYGVQCVKNGFTYVGRSTDHRKRWRIHRRLLKRGAHTVAGMLADWRKFGESGFDVRVLEPLAYDVGPEAARAAERRWQNHYARLGLLYNAPQCAMCGRPYDLDEEDDGKPTAQRSSRRRSRGRTQ